MKTNLDCAYCILQKADERYEKLEPDHTKKLAFMKRVFSLIGESPEDVTAPYLSKCVNDLLQDEFVVRDDYSALKTQYNNLMMTLEAKIKSEIGRSDNVLLAALRYAMVGNFIDFAAMDDITPEKLCSLIESASNQNIDQNQFASFLSDLSSAKNLVYLLDNAGEIVFDKIFMSIIKNQFPDVHITAVVRGKPVFNDVTLPDAEETGLSKLVEVIDNGTDIPGTQLDHVNKQAVKVIEEADLIISKGQGNFETLYGCGKNIYYIFLCKCDLFVRRFGLPRFSGIFSNENSLKF